MAILLPLFVLLIVVVCVTDIAMKICVNDRLPAEERFSWWNRDSWRVARKHKELFPNSNLPMISQFGFWFAVAMSLIWLVLSFR